MSLRQPTSFHSSNISSFDNNHNEEVDFDFFDGGKTNDHSDVNKQNCGLSSPCTPTKFLTEVIIETQRDVDSHQDETLKEEGKRFNSKSLLNSNVQLNSPELDIHSPDCDRSLVNCIAYADENEDEKFEGDGDSYESLSESTNTSDLTTVTPMSSSSGSLNMYKQSMAVDQTEEQSFINKMEGDGIAETRLESSDSEEETELMSLAKSLETLSIPNSSTCSRVMSSYSGKSKPKRKSMTFTNEQLRKINRDNDILLRKIMDHAKPRPKQTSTVHNFHPTRTSAAINRLRQQKQIEHDNYILLNKIRDVKQTRKSIFGTGCTT